MDQENRSHLILCAEEIGGSWTQLPRGLYDKVSENNDSSESH